MFFPSARFRRHFRRCQKKIQATGFARLALLEQSEFDPALNNHKLSGEYEGYRSINVTGDIRIIYKRVPGGFYLLAVGTHSELYK
ncbi:MAG: hypothetical protein A2W52_04580 [Candidatus Taylorbacteria bacterium RIFCSPHIGHO2_02_49_25]|uniref:Type II toxin-antitoxin system mRNA interferase toxin, RelE/StbE family n=1 Tax=Candidatus Taylorbacteria bacterium RIFCSPHIGHO2_02_49_25 TaxID=1802305 RepID=A0A1G2ME60_9BACT|nr:MAG: hypothetical protein UY62_C0023G0010 [Parcubacteria group bacterium GW2011_GWF2_50_9]OHA21292.1 MAG: hypothetical protein A2W52_04580 [Candidatus Taylorbacteria bacterium RIFCSPHIGHO2_02_49_25]OHA21485.1 MAG: hypothetical protein A2759_02505 [Candidatus Taylorbacteria bacterium RIFCSPHIGHO2_01_FULL_49_60]OHA36004.1 MAG: hypothetical protein A3B27_03135 [Candidatus Taylorbacteria bacterium RIFCSPLOWO2_01_FULL_50_130]OHA36433.1 MAG: hypothetical protein A2W65_02570 [Candidatus Taylorbacte